MVGGPPSMTLWNSAWIFWISVSQIARDTFLCPIAVVAGFCLCFSFRAGFAHACPCPGKRPYFICTHLLEQSVLSFCSLFGLLLLSCLVRGSCASDASFGSSTLPLPGCISLGVLVLYLVCLFCLLWAYAVCCWLLLGLLLVLS